MKLTFLGATHEVTGSCTLIEIGGRYGIVDCGMEQGQDFFEKPAGGDLSWRCCDVCSPGPPLVRVKASVSVHGAAGMQAQARPHLSSSFCSPG